MAPCRHARNPAAERSRPGPRRRLRRLRPPDEPPGLAAAKVRPDAALFSDALKEFLLPYDVVRRSPDPAKTILDFAESTYDAGSKLAGWNRDALTYP